MKGKKMWKAEQFLALTVLVFLLAYTLLNAHLLYRPAKQLLKGESNFDTFVAEIKETYTSVPLWKSAFVNLNGLFSKITGQRLCNHVIRLDNGMLCDELPMSQKPYPMANEVVRFNEYLAERDIPFLYVMTPYKVDINNQLLPDGLAHYANSDAGVLLSSLEQGGVSTMDLRPMFSGTPEQVEENFFRTDHHWKLTAALKAVPMLVERMDQMLPDRALDASYASFDQWEAHTLEDWFLGSWGKRTGVLFGGVDDVTYYTPKFDTQMSTAIPNHFSLSAGDFVQANMHMEYTQRKDYFNDSPYCIYIGGDYPLVVHHNLGAPNELRVLLVKDSFFSPAEAFFSTLFSEVHAIDSRFDQSSFGSVAEYVNNMNPDLVLMIINPMGLSQTSYADLGIDAELAREQAATGVRTVLEQGDVALTGIEEQNEYFCYRLDTIPEPGKRYTIRFDDVRLEDGSAPTEGVSAALFNAEMECIINNHIFELDYERQARGYFSWTFQVPADMTDQLQLLLYAGLPGQTQGVALTYRNVTLTLEE